MTGIALDRMPEMVDGEDIVGSLTPQAAADLGLAASTLVLGAHRT